MLHCVLTELFQAETDVEVVKSMVKTAIQGASLLREDLLKDLSIIRAIAIEPPLEQFLARDECIEELLAATDRLAGFYRKLQDGLKGQLAFTLGQTTLPPNWEELSGHLRHSRMITLAMTYSDLVSSDRDKKRWELRRIDFLTQYLGHCVRLGKPPSQEELDPSTMARAVKTASQSYLKLGVA